MWEYFPELKDILGDFITNFFWWLIAAPSVVLLLWFANKIKFWWNNRTKVHYFLGREKETSRLVMKIKTGQSGVIIGIFGQERTEMLTCLRDCKFYGREIDNLIFSHVDISSLEKNFEPKQFWEKILEPLREKIFRTNCNALKKTFSECQAKHFSNDCLDKLFEEVNQANLRLVLFLDRFHEILHKPNLKQKVFLANLRSLSTSVHPSPLCLVITVHESLSKLHERFIEEMGYSTSPFFNFMDVGEITLGALPELDRDKVLKKLKLSKKAQSFIKDEVGRHPYLLRIATNRLKEAYKLGEKNPVEVTKQDFNKLCAQLLRDMQSTWHSKMCQIFVQIAQGTFSNPANDYVKELEELEKQGLIKQENAQWQVLSPVFVKLLKERDVSTLCTKK